MKILVLLAGVADIRLPLHPISLSSEALIQEQGSPRRLLSPFDEAALEVALKLRDARTETQIDVLLLDGCNSENLLRSVAAFCPDSLRCLQLQPCQPWDARQTATQIAGVIKRDYLAHDLVLLGRELGDLDEGSIAVLLARRLGRPQLAMAQFGQWQGAQLWLMRDRGTCEEWLKVDQPLLASVTNDRRNKLRHPLLKNVMQAKRMTFTQVTASAPTRAGLSLSQLETAPLIARGGQCRLLSGDVTDQAKALIGWLKEQGVNS
ncbi:electron transfer flavoprotein subunit beta/FixA family protein [Pseudomonas izuensis]|uniref:Electron transfer flavoprotein subunit beta n=1 Tax=Pseudomonas izuensis TaxID=2684212 RepID=A0ABM7RS79_9PSED|nr:electron transfer flavoprotein subunit beta [Pseudomonas izuensis]BCX68223.1 electron transfer flavoprotein subunit beta [Pseudomonas izuensis]